jgi:hypothetical protein
LCGAGLIVTARARAQTPPPPANAISTDAERGYTIAVVANPDRAALVARLRAELGDLGFKVEEAPADLGSEALDALTDGTHYLALIRIDEAGQAIEFRVRARDTGKLLHDRIALRPRRADVAAVATVELLRARLIKLGLLPASASAPPAAPLPPPPPPVPLDFPSVTADFNAGAWYSAGGLGVSPAIMLGLRAHPKRWLAVGALGAFGAFEPQASAFSASQGEVQSRATLLGVITDFGFGVGRTHFEFGGGVALSLLSLTGQARPPFAGRVTHSYGAAPIARANFGFRLAGPVSLHLQTLAGVSSPRVAVQFAGDTVAHWGRPLVLSLIGLEVGF